MKIKTGVDIIEVKRVQEAIERSGEIFLNKVYTNEEIEYCNNSGKMKYQHFAARFAAKEAVFKAISEELESDRSDFWKDICVKNNENGKPFIELHNINSSKIESMDLSISHIKDYAIANFVIILN